MTQPVIIRGLEVADSDAIADILLSPTCQRQTLQLPFQSRDRMKDRTEKMAKEEHSLVAVIDDIVVGMLGLEIGKGRRAHVGKIGMVVRDDFQHQGIGSRLLECGLNLTRLELHVYCDNTAAIQLYQKYGLKLKGRCDNMRLEMANMSMLMQWQRYDPARIAYSRIASNQNRYIFYL